MRDIAERTAIPQPYLEQILLALKGAGLVRSKRGVGGGYVLARTPAEIRISEILSAVDGPISLGDFGEPHQDGACDHEGQCVLLAIWKTAGEHMRHILDGFTLQSVADAARGTSPWPDALVDVGLERDGFRSRLPMAYTYDSFYSDPPTGSIAGGTSVGWSPAPAACPCACGSPAP